MVLVFRLAVVYWLLVVLDTRPELDHQAHWDNYRRYRELYHRPSQGLVLAVELRLVLDNHYLAQPHQDSHQLHRARHRHHYRLVVVYWLVGQEMLVAGLAY